MRIKGIVEEDFIQYKKPSMVIMMPYCDWKCGKDLCQNSPLALAPVYEVTNEYLIERYLNNNITKALVFSGLEPWSSFKDMVAFIADFRKETEDTIVIYTGYTKREVLYDLTQLKEFPNIIIKFGRFIPNDESIFDETLGVTLASQNQFAEKIS